MTNLVKVEEKVGFSKAELVKVQEYLEKTGPQPLPPQVSEKIFEAYLSGSSLAEVSRFHNEYSQGAIYFTAYHYNWPAIRDEIVQDIQVRIKQKVLYSKYQQIELVGSMIQVAHVEAMQAMQTYLKHPNDRNLPKSLRIKTIKDLSLAIEMMANVIGQDNMKKIDISGNITTSSTDPVTVTPGSKDGTLTENTAKALLKAMNKQNGKVIDVEPDK